MQPERRVAGAERQGAPGKGVAGQRPPRARQRPPERVRRAHARSRSPDAAPQRHGCRGRAVVGLEQHRLGVRRGLRRPVEPLLGPRGVQCGRRGCRVTQGSLGLRQQVERRGQRQPLGGPTQADGGSPQIAVRRVSSCESNHPGREARQRPQRGGVGQPRGLHAAALQLEVAQQHLDVGHVLGRAAGGDRQPHRLDRPRQVAGQLAVVRRARVRREPRLGVDQPLDQALRVAVAAELDRGVGDHGQRPCQLGRDRRGAPA